MACAGTIGSFTWRRKRLIIRHEKIGKPSADLITYFQSFWIWNESSCWVPSFSSTKNDVPCLSTQHEDWRSRSSYWRQLAALKVALRTGHRDSSWHLWSGSELWPCGPRLFFNDRLLSFAVCRWMTTTRKTSHYGGGGFTSTITICFDFFMF